MPVPAKFNRVITPLGLEFIIALLAWNLSRTGVVNSASESSIPLGDKIMQKATLAAALVAVLGFALNTSVFAADAGAADKTSAKTETTTKSEKTTEGKKGKKKDKKETKETKETTPTK
jgi:mannitol-specific phosphotransferase system IIBC component